MESKIKVIELFAGVGGFRIGLEGWNNKSASSGFKKKIEPQYEIVWSNQWEPVGMFENVDITSKGWAFFFNFFVRSFQKGFTILYAKCSII